MKVLVIGDPHFKKSNPVETEQMWKCIIKLAKQVLPNFIVCLGDILDRHENINVYPLKRSTYFLHDLSEIAPLYIIIGNHDRPNNSTYLTDDHPFVACKWWYNTKVIDKPILEIIEGLKFLFVPYVYPGRFYEALEELKLSLEEINEGLTAAFAHQEFKNAKMGSIISVNGDIWEKEYPLMISDHIHDYDELQENLIYIGTPLQHAFGDRSDKTVSIFNFEENEKYIHERIDLKLTKKQIIYLTSEELKNFKLPDNIFLKIKVRGTLDENAAVSNLPSVLELSKHTIIVYETINNKQIETEEIVTQNYSTLLYDSIKNDINLRKTYENLFGKVNNKIKISLKKNRG